MLLRRQVRAIHTCDEWVRNVVNAWAHDDVAQRAVSAHPCGSQPASIRLHFPLASYSMFIVSGILAVHLRRECHLESQCGRHRPATHLFLLCPCISFYLHFPGAFCLTIWQEYTCTLPYAHHTHCDEAHAKPPAPEVLKNGERDINAAPPFLQSNVWV